MADIVTRIFMLFRTVLPADLRLSTTAAARAAAEDGAIFWTRVVGVDAVRASDHRIPVARVFFPSVYALAGIEEDLGRGLKFEGHCHGGSGETEGGK